MLNLILFTLNVVFICAMMTFAPAVAFAFANSTTANGRPFWPMLLPRGLTA